MDGGGLVGWWRSWRLILRCQELCFRHEMGSCDVLFVLCVLEGWEEVRGGDGVAYCGIYLWGGRFFKDSWMMLVWWDGESFWMFSCVVVWFFVMDVLMYS